MSLNNSERQQVLALAKRSIQQGLEQGRPVAVKLADYAPALTVLRATFVTLEIDAQLRGCVGRLEATRPLVQDVAENAYSAAFEDSRFSPVTQKEFEQLALHISILSPSEPVVFSSEADLLRQLRPLIDGLILVEGRHRATFLPSVWESLPEPQVFLEQLKRKAGFPAHYWSDTLKAFRYTAEVFG